MIYNSPPTGAYHSRYDDDKSINAPNSGGRVGRMKDQEQEIEGMTKQIFNLKLRIFYLEEALSRERAGGAPDIGEMAEENLETKLLLEERTQELEEINMRLVKARNAIESLQADVELFKTHQDDTQSAKYKTLMEKFKEKEVAVQRAESRIQALSSTEALRREEIANLTTQVKDLQKSLSKANDDSHSTAKLRESFMVIYIYIHTYIIYIYII